MNEWEEFSLGEVLEDKGYIRGPFGSSLKRGEMQADGIPVYEQINAIYNSRDFRYYISEEKFNELRRFQVCTNDLIISCSGTVGKISIIQENDPKGIISQALLILRPDIRKIDLKFLYYFLSSKKGLSLLTQVSHGSVQINIAARKIVESIPLLIPSIPEQKAIAGVLSSLDNKIDLLQRQNKTLEAMAETMFRQWFIEEAKDDWEEGCLGNVIEIYDSKRIPLSSIERNKKKTGELFPYYGATTIMDYINDYIFDGEYILLAEDGSVRTNDGFPILQYATGKFWVNNHAHVFKAKLPYSDFFLLTFLKNTNIDHLITGAVQPKINQKNLKSIAMPKFPSELVEQYNQATEAIFAKIKLNNNHILKVEELKNILLPKLMSGEITVKH